MIWIYQKDIHGVLVVQEQIIIFLIKVNVNHKYMVFTNFVKISEKKIEFSLRENKRTSSSFRVIDGFFI